MSSAGPVGPQLLAAWQRTEYRVQTGEGSLVLHIGEASTALRELLRREGVACAAYITADNPGSRTVPDWENRPARQRLKARLRAGGWRWLPGLGVDPDGDHPGEHSLLVLGITTADAIAIGREFGQDAILLVAEDAVPRLALCSEG